MPWVLAVYFCLQAQRTQPGVVIRSAAQRPVEFALRFRDDQVVDAGEAPGHQAVFGELPVLQIPTNS